MNYTKEIEEYEDYLIKKELAETTRKIYLSQAEKFLKFIDNRKITKQETISYKKLLMSQDNKLSTVNLHIVALNSYLKYACYPECTVKTQKKQNRQTPDALISPEEYKDMLEWAKVSGRKKYYYIMRTLALTGIRVSELSGCSTDALERGKFIVCNKGKSREVFIPDKLITELKEYCSECGIKEGLIFRGNTGKPISRIAVYKMIVKIADDLDIPKGKVHPHSFRHLFAVTYMKQYANLFELADLLGHSSLETTRIYTAITAEEKRRKINELNL